MFKVYDSDGVVSAGPEFRNTASATARFDAVIAQMLTGALKTGGYRTFVRIHRHAQGDADLLESYDVAWVRFYDLQHWAANNPYAVGYLRKHKEENQSEVYCLDGTDMQGEYQFFVALMRRDKDGSPMTRLQEAFEPLLRSSVWIHYS